MFMLFLFGTLGVSIAALLYLLIAPRARAARKRRSNDAVPYAGAALIVLLCGIAFLGGLAVAG